MDNENTEQGAQQPVQKNVSSGMNPKALFKLPIPLFVVAAYLAMGLLWERWHPGWLIFFLIPVYYQLAAMANIQELRKKLQAFPIAVLCVAAYLAMGFYFGMWHPTWMIFLVIPLYHWYVAASFKKTA